MVRSTLRPEPPPSVVVALLSTVPLVPYLLPAASVPVTVAKGRALAAATAAVSYTHLTLPTNREV